jgi:thiamine biosynthesis protein ThiI
MKVISLISGGFDSAVSSYEMLCKGVEVVFVHFHPQKITLPSDNKVFRIAQRLKEFGRCEKLYLVPFMEIQKEIVKHVPSRLRMLVYRRMMLRIAGEVLKKEEGFALLTGDSLGQVASQTVENLRVVYSAAPQAVLTPLLGADKSDILQAARKIETYELSVLPYEDCCSFLVPPHPETRASLKDIETAEKPLNIPELVATGLAQAKLVLF